MLRFVAVIVASDEFPVNDVVGGNLDKKGRLDGITITQSQITDTTITATNLNILDDGADTTLHFHDSDRSRANHTGTQLLSTISDVTITAANLNILDDGVDTTLHFHDSDRARANHTGTQTISTLSDLDTGIVTFSNKSIALGSNTITGTAAEFDTAVTDDNFVFDGATNVLTGAIQITAGTMRIPLSATPTMAVDGDFAIDTTITDFSMGLIKYFDGEEMAVISIPIAQLTSPTDGHVISYNATNDEFELVASAGGGGDDLGDHTATEIIKSVTFGLQGQETGQTIIGTTALTGWDYTVPAADAHDFIVTGTGTIAQIDSTGLDVQNGTVQEDGVDISPIGIHDIPISASSMYGTTLTPATGLNNTLFATNEIDIKTFDFTSTILDNRVQFRIPFPRNYNNGAITVTINWSFSAGSGDVVWRVGAVATGDNDAIDAAFTFSADLVDTAGTANQVQRTTTASFTPGGTPADNDELHFEIMRQGSDVADTFTSIARLHSVVIHITTDEATAA